METVDIILSIMPHVSLRREPSSETDSGYARLYSPNLAEKERHALQCSCECLNSFELEQLPK